MSGCAIAIVKYALFLFNLLFVLGAIAFIAIGVVFKLNIDSVTEALKDADINFSLAPTLAIVVGVIVFIIAFFGCCGAIKESTCMLTTYAVILLVVFLLEIGLGVFAFLQYKDSDHDLQSDIKKALKKAFDNYGENKTKEAVDVLQNSLECCGYDGPDYWHHGIPSSCCPKEPASCQRENAYREGCSTKFFTFFEKSLHIVGIVVIVVAVVELVGAIIALCLASSIRNAERRGNYA